MGDRGGRPARLARHAAIFAAAFLVLFLRRPETLARAEFWNEDGQVFFVGSFFGSPLEQLTRSYAGYLHVVPRVVAWAERTVDVSLAPLVGNAIALVSVAALATYIASDRLAGLLPSRSVRLLLAVGLVLLPGSWETLGSITLIQWYLGIFLVVASLTTPAVGRLALFGESLALAAAGLSGPFSVLFAPLFWVRAWRYRDYGALFGAAVVSACAGVQVVAFLSGQRETALSTPAGAAALLLARTWSSVIGDFWLAGAIQLSLPLPIVLLATTGLVASLAAVWSRGPAVVRSTIAFVALVSVIAAVASAPAAFPVSTYLGGRYFLIPTFLVVLSLAVWLGGGQPRRRFVLAATALAALAVLGIVGDFRLPPHETHDWAVRSRCIGGPTPCTVPVDYENAWTIHWPGSNGSYVQPTQSGANP